MRKSYIKIHMKYSDHSNLIKYDLGLTVGGSLINLYKTTMFYNISQG